MIDVVVLVVLAVVVAVIGIRIGMLLAPRLGRLGEPADDEATPSTDDDH